jgi:hypothetical protein
MRFIEVMLAALILTAIGALEPKPPAAASKDDYQVTTDDRLVVHHKFLAKHTCTQEDKFPTTTCVDKSKTENWDSSPAQPCMQCEASQFVRNDGTISVSSRATFCSKKYDSNGTFYQIDTSYTDAECQQQPQAIGPPFPLWSIPICGTDCKSCSTPYAIVPAPYLDPRSCDASATNEKQCKSPDPTFTCRWLDLPYVYNEPVGAKGGLTMYHELVKSSFTYDCTSVYSPHGQGVEHQCSPSEVIPGKAPISLHDCMKKCFESSSVVV